MTPGSVDTRADERIGPIAAPDTGSPEVHATEPLGSADNDSELTGQAQMLFAELSGMDADSLDPRATFRELGLDSLFFAQVSSALEQRFGVEVSLLELLQEGTAASVLALTQIVASR